MNIINNLGPIPSSIEVGFSWSPATTVTITGFPDQPGAAHATSLTFTATTQIDNDPQGLLSIIEYRWEFGDGVTGYGNGATHTYLFANYNAYTVLRVTDSQGRYWYDRRQMYLT